MSIVRPLLLVAATALVGSSSLPVARSAERAPLGGRGPIGAREVRSARGESASAWRARCALGERPRYARPEAREAEALVREEAPSREAELGAALLELLRAAPEPGLNALARAGEPFLALLPLDALEFVGREGDELVLRFDTGGLDALVVPVPARRELALDAEPDELDALRRGRAVAITSDARRLRIARELRFQLDERGIARVRAGDLEVVKGPFHVDLDVRTELRHGVARDKYGRTLLATDERGEPVRRDGRYVAEEHDAWLVLEALGHRVEVGL